MKNDKFWYFRFEGVFTWEHPDYPELGVFSSCLVPESNHEEAKAIFFQALKSEKIDFLELLEEFDINEAELDPSDERNDLWIDWYRKVAKSNEIEFDIWHLYERSRKQT